MISPSKVLSILKEKGGIAQRHPEFVGFVGETLRSGLKPGDRLVLAVVHEDRTKEQSVMKVTAEDQKVLSDVGSIFR